MRVMRVKGLDYLYVWHYETFDGGRKQVLDYVGPAKDPESGRKAVNMMDEYVRKAIAEAKRQLQIGASSAMATTRRRAGVILKQG